MHHLKVNIKQWLLLGSGPLLLWLCSQLNIDGLSAQAMLVAGVSGWMIIWWVSEAVPLPVTSLLPMLLFPLLGVSNAEAATSPYAHPLIFLFFGGFCLSIAMEKTDLHKQIAVRALALVGPNPAAQLGAIMLITAFLSMWMSNTATAVMMLPIALALSSAAPVALQAQLIPALLLGVAYSASIGGIATLIGTPPNALLAAFLAKTYQINIGFGQWMLLGVPLAIITLFACWLWLSRWHFRLHLITAVQPSTLSAKSAGFASPESALATTPSSALTTGLLTAQQKRLAIVFVLTACCWIFQPLLSKWSGLALSDTVIALLAAMALFVLPCQGKPLINWQDSDKIPWGVLLLFGGGLSMAAQIQQSGLADYLAGLLNVLDGVRPVFVVLAVVALIVFLTEVTSNTAVAAAFLPLLGPVALSLQLSPLYLTVPAALAASFAFMMPVGTPPNAIVFASGQLRIIDMVKAGFILNLLSIGLITACCYLILPYWL